MPNSQFRLYSDGDVGAPKLVGQTGSLITLLNYCLVSGSGWSQSFSSGSLFAAYQPASGSKMNLFINDSGPNATALGKEAWGTGWENITGLGSPAGGNMTGSVGGGKGQFPLPAQSLTDGKVVWRKSMNPTGSGIFPSTPYQIYVDAYTMYYFGISDSTATTRIYYAFWFGDIYSLKGATDNYRCMIYGRTVENSVGGAATNDTMDLLGNLNVTAANSKGMYMARSYTGVGGSVTANKLGDGLKHSGTAGTTQTIEGVCAHTPNYPDNSYCVAPISIWEHVGLAIRGRLRGLWHWGHPATNIADGSVISGSNAQLGKIFKTINGGVNGGVWLVETSNTVETN